MSKLLIKILIIPCFCVLFLSVKSQNKVTEPAPLPPKVMQCTTDLFSKAEYYYQMRKFRGSEGHFQSVPYIKKILDVCPNADLLPYLNKRLEILAEEDAEKNLLAGNAYLKMFRLKGKGLRGAQSRFLNIVDKYPNYSKMDEVLFLLGETYLLEKKYDEAKKYYQKLIKSFPKSTYTKEAKEKIKISRAKQMS